MFPSDTRILIVDDTNTMRQILKNQLKEMGFSNLQESENGQAAFDLLKKLHDSGQPIQLLLCDWAMPLMTGIELLKKLRATPEFKTLPFVMVTTEGGQPQLLEAIQSGVSNYLIKPVNQSNLKEKLEATWKKLQAKG